MKKSSHPHRLVFTPKNALSPPPDEGLGGLPAGQLHSHLFAERDGEAQGLVRHEELPGGLGSGLGTHLARRMLYLPDQQTHGAPADETSWMVPGSAPGPPQDGPPGHPTTRHLIPRLGSLGDAPDVCRRTSSQVRSGGRCLAGGVDPSALRGSLSPSVRTPARAPLRCSCGGNVCLHDVSELSTNVTACHCHLIQASSGVNAEYEGASVEGTVGNLIQEQEK